MKCYVCGRDIDALGQDNVSVTPGYPLCEDCGYDSHEEDDFYPSYYSRTPNDYERYWRDM